MELLVGRQRDDSECVSDCSATVDMLEREAILSAVYLDWQALDSPSNFYSGKLIWKPLTKLADQDEYQSHS